MWKIIPEHPKYEVSNDGEVRHIKSHRVKSIRVKDGYCFVGLSVSHKVKKWVSLHRLVAKAFIANPKNKPEVNHKDGNKLNCHHSNLEWNTKKENVHHAIRTGLFIPTEINTRPVIQYDLNWNFIKEWNSCRFAERELNYANGVISATAKGKNSRKQTGGFRWKFKDSIPLSQTSMV